METSNMAAGSLTSLFEFYIQIQQIKLKFLLGEMMKIKNWFSEIVVRVIALHPNSVFLKNPKSGLWYEVSCEGNILFKTQGGERIPVEEETNHLQDGSLINVGYSTFLWKFRENLNTLPQRAELEDSLSINLFDSTKSNNDSYIILPRGPEDKGLDIYACRECGCIQLKNISPNDTECKCKMQKMFFDPQLVFFTNMAETYCAFTPCGHVINKEAAM
jgi:hypothetical protein